MNKKEKKEFKHFYERKYREYQRADYIYQSIGDITEKRHAEAMKQSLNDMSDLWEDVLHQRVEDIIKWEIEIDREFELYKRWAE